MLPRNPRVTATLAQAPLMSHRGNMGALVCEERKPLRRLLLGHFPAAWRGTPDTRPCPPWYGAGAGCRRGSLTWSCPVEVSEPCVLCSKSVTLLICCPALTAFSLLPQLLVQGFILNGAINPGRMPAPNSGKVSLDSLLPISRLPWPGPEPPGVPGNARPTPFRPGSIEAALTAVPNRRCNG